MARFGWLHLSDLHLGPHGSRLLQPEYREALEQDLRRMHAQSGLWHVVFISGDLTLTGSHKEFALLSTTLGSLWDYLRSLGSKPCLMVVPGNHDVSRASTLGKELEKRYRALDLRESFQGRLRSSPGTLALDVQSGFGPFSTWCVVPAPL